MTQSKETVMRGLSVLLVRGLLVGGLLAGGFLGVAWAQPAGSAVPAAGSAAPAAGSAAPAADAAGSAVAAPAADAAGSAPAASAAGSDDASAQRKACVAAMNSNEGFARSIIQKAIETDRVSVGAMCADVDTVKTHQQAVAYVEKNERHVIEAYAAMWVIAALFLLYLLRRQQRLRAEIDQLRRDLDAAAKDGK